MTMTQKQPPSAVILPEGVGLPPGAQPLEHLRQVIERLGPSWKGRRPLVMSHRSPDPDALGAMFGVGFLLREAFGLEPEIAATGEIRRAENQAMVRELGLEYRELSSLGKEKFAGIFLVDTQPGFGHTTLPDQPMVAVFDHHRPPPEANRNGLGPVPHCDVRLGVGATSAIIYGYCRDAGLTLDPGTAAALCCGVRFDTADLSQGATPLDAEAFFETFRLADRAKLARIARPTLPASYYGELHRALVRGRRHGTVMVGFLGRIENPESVAEMADFFLRMEGAELALVGGAFGERYHLSVRSESREAYPLLEAVLRGEGSFGGRDGVAGGQILLESGDEAEIKRLERRLKARLMKIIDVSDRDAASISISRLA
ncbi:MAG: hypothetical protein CMJ89_06665 [Planctomycetes bacterium]|jgi:nanoRNase/pAp phosphatase (c-di-AMP/oligoRNAs hydrolase)|nr:hypothetical protein [Planctomycetota bacterium]